ncbi:MAG TPA: hypothetical protein VNG90_02010 [Candidatus Acidoferrum sp.]|nr:hypothetical protein [Candidatus Acidoferrum sp.]
MFILGFALHKIVVSNDLNVAHLTLITNIKLETIASTTGKSIYNHPDQTGVPISAEFVDRLRNEFHFGEWSEVPTSDGTVTFLLELSMEDASSLNFLEVDERFARAIAPFISA